MSRRKKKPEDSATAQQKWDDAFAQIDHSSLCRELGVDVDDELLKLALTHRSFAHEHEGLPHNERLEFLGDAVLGLVVAEKLYIDHPDRPESDISKMRASVVSRYGCAEVARNINLGAHLLLGRGELSTGGRSKESILADTTEAVLGAVYRQWGFEVAREVVFRLFADLIARAHTRGMYEDWKTALQERAAVLELPMAEYSAVKEGPEHDLTFTATVAIAGHDLGQGQGRNKKFAEQNAAHQAYLALTESGWKGLSRTLRAAAEEQNADQPDEGQGVRDA